MNPGENHRVQGPETIDERYDLMSRHDLATRSVPESSWQVAARITYLLLGSRTAICYAPARSRPRSGPKAHFEHRNPDEAGSGRPMEERWSKTWKW